ncbi:MAG: oligosaccharide flippase family protein [Candidatus Pacebacteria bacterium]|nr:oligosaccharide flippase family protein [Candidatus Paceibacterota bacterium]
MKSWIVHLLRKTEKYTETDMVYAVKGSFWIILANLGIFAISFAKMIAFGRYASPDVYGTYNFIISMAGILSIFALSGMSTSLVKAIAQNKDGTLALAVKEKVKFGLIGSLLSFGASCWYLYNGNTTLWLGFLAVAIFLPFYNAFGLYSSFWFGKKNFEKKGKYEFTVAAITAVLVITTIILTQNPAYMIVVLFGSSTILYGFFFLRTLRQKSNDDVLPEAIGFGKHLTVMSAIGTVVAHIDKIILWKLFGPVQLATYAFAQMPVQYIQGIIPIGSLALPKMGEKSVGSMKVGITKKFKKLFIITIPVTIAVILLAPYLYSWFIPQYMDSVPYFQLFALLILLSPFGLLSTAITAEMRSRDLYIINTATPVLKIGLFLVLIPLFGVWGLVWAVVLTELFSGFLSLYFFNKIV